MTQLRMPPSPRIPSSVNHQCVSKQPIKPKRGAQASAGLTQIELRKLVRLGAIACTIEDLAVRAHGAVVAVLAHLAPTRRIVGTIKTEERDRAYMGDQSSDFQ